MGNFSVSMVVRKRVSRDEGKTRAKSYGKGNMATSGDWSHPRGRPLPSHDWRETGTEDRTIAGLHV